MPSTALVTRLTSATTVPGRARGWARRQPLRARTGPGWVGPTLPSWPPCGRSFKFSPRTPHGRRTERRAGRWGSSPCSGPAAHHTGPGLRAATRAFTGVPDCRSVSPCRTGASRYGTCSGALAGPLPGQAPVCRIVGSVPSLRGQGSTGPAAALFCAAVTPQPSAHTSSAGGWPPGRPRPPHLSRSAADCQSSPHMGRGTHLIHSAGGVPDGPEPITRGRTRTQRAGCQGQVAQGPERTRTWTRRAVAGSGCKVQVSRHLYCNVANEPDPRPCIHFDSTCVTCR